MDLRNPTSGGGSTDLSTFPTSSGAITLASGSGDFTLHASGYIRTDSAIISSSYLNALYYGGGGYNTTIIGGYPTSAYVGLSTYFNDAMIAFTTGLNAAETPDTGITRSAAGIIEINKGTAGKFGQLKSGTISLQSLTTPVIASVTPVGTTGAATWTYKAVALQADGSYTAASTAVSTTTGNATLTGGNYNAITVTAVTGATSYDIYRTVSGGTPATLGKIGNITGVVLNDTGLAGDASTAPTVNTTGAIISGTNQDIKITPNGTGVVTSAAKLSAPQLAAGSAHATGSVYGDVTAAQSSNVGLLWLGSDGASYVFKSGSDMFLVVPTGVIKAQGTGFSVVGPTATSAAAPTIASATTIAPTTAIAFISGTTAIATITAPAPISAGGGTITLIPTGIFTTTTAGNIALASTAVVSKALTMTYDTTSGKFYPSY